MPLLSYEIDGRVRLGRIEGDRVRGFTDIDRLGPGLDGAVDADPRMDEETVALDAVRMLPASPSARKILCVGLNYGEHIAETGRERPEYPVLFPKYASNLIGPRSPIELPAESAQVDYEGELAVILGRGGRRIAEDEAEGHVLGYAVANDVTMRDFQYKTHQWMQGKAWDRSTPLDATITRPDEVDLSRAAIRTTFNGEVVQESSLEHLIFSIPRLIATISMFTELACGDVILTGTPGGVGYRRDPQLFIQPDDIVAVEVDGVGRIENRARRESARVRTH
jgi:acylpyruvate hydrolase